MAKAKNELGNYLQDRRSKLDPAALGYPMARRRTPGLRREEVASRANVSTTWYTWLEQGRGGAPSATVLDCIARALMLTDVEREHLYLLGLGRLPDVRYEPIKGISPRLQGVLDAMELSAAFVRTSTWDVVGWNKASTLVLTDYGSLPLEQRNILKQIFTNPHIRKAQMDWEAIAGSIVSSFRADIARAGATGNVTRLVDELREISPEFDKIWRSNDISGLSEGTKQIRHPRAGLLTMEFSSFAVDGRPDLHMIVYTPATAADKKKVRLLIAASA